MRDFPSCFGENGVQVADSSTTNAAKNAHNLTTRIYQAKLRGRSCLITVAWNKNMMGQGLSVGIDDCSSNQSLCKVDIKPWLFSKRKGSKTLESYSTLIDVYWDLSAVKFGSGPEPSEGFYVAVVVDRQMILLLGDLRKEAFKKTGACLAPSTASFVAKREHIFGKKVFVTKAQFCDNGQLHDLAIQCDTSIQDLSLVIQIDRKPMMQVKRLQWKFRGNHTILVDGLAVEVYWDVYNWLFGSGAASGNAVFMFSLSADKSWVSPSHTLGDSWSFPQRFLDTKSSHSLGFSLILHAWKNE
ncbi:hypothetical protein SAY87_010527 [Trapa incisa]|uniref:Uncharacterized protein n=2 Tax=Trapa TaxID=22665 RepID=A0AAN7RBZ8_TRANT|nr:hypothetical protein SAY87_010527 [Trapa incisa]KAK4794881.1 hypothetical protein SAY86_012875 [Trapa natans]